MASSNSPESPSKKRKQIDRGAHGRREPLFAAHRPVASLQQPPDFLTDSLNTSQIPTPSPTRSPIRPDLLPRPRRHKLHRSTQSTSNVANSQDEIAFFPEPFELEIGGHRAQARKLQAQQTHVRSTPRSAASAQSLHRVRTPSPPRGRQLPVETSPANSEPSPGRGYTEAYQRIVEEENLAHEESIDDIDNEDLDGSYNHVSQDLELPSQSRARQMSSSPSPFRSRSRLTSPYQGKLGVMDRQEDKENLPNFPDGDSESIEDEDPTRSSLESNISQHKKDLELLNKIKSHPRAFSRAQIGSKNGAVLENLNRRGSNESLRSSRSGGSFSITSEPALNVPKAWGRKAKPTPEWLNRINTRKSRPGAVSGLPTHLEDGGKKQEDGRSGKVDEWMAAAEIPLPSSERGSSLVVDGPPAANNLQRPPGALPSRHSWNIDDDFTGRSLQISDSPPMKLGKGPVDSDFEREIQSLEGQAIATARVGLVDGRPSGKDHKNQASSGMPAVLEDERQRRVLNHEDEDPAGDSPVFIYKSKEDENKVVNRRPQPGIDRPQQQRKDSHDILKRLARAASQSPNSEKQAQQAKQQTRTRSEEAKTPRLPQQNQRFKTPTVTGAWVDQSVHEGTQAPTTVRNVKTPHVTGGWVNTPMPATVKQENKERLLDNIKEESPRSKVAAADLVKELNPNAKHSPKKTKIEAPLPYSGPPLPKSALQNILDGAKGGVSLPIIAGSDNEDDTFRLGDSTIQSLEELVVDGRDLATILPASPEEPATSSSSDPSPQKQPRNRKGGKSGSQTNLLSRLNSLAPSIRESKKQLAALERSISAPTHPSSNLSHDNELDTCVEGGPIHDFLLPCTKCGDLTHLQAPAPLPGYLTLKDNLSQLPNQMTTLSFLPPQLRNSFTTLPDLPHWPSLHLLGQHPDGFTHLHLTLPIPKLWTWPPSSSRPRLTYLGLAVLLYIIWDVAEQWACLHYCHPWWGAWDMEGYGVDITAPRPPFVIFKVLWGKWGLRDAMQGGVMMPFMVVWRLFRMLIWAAVEYLVDFMFGTGQQAGEGPNSAAGAWGRDASMVNDEYL